MVQLTKAHARATTNQKQKNHATQYLMQDEQAQIAADMAELRAKHSVRFRGGSMANLKNK